MESQSKIRQLKFPDTVRLNPYQQLGDLNDASVLFRELLDNARDELIASKDCDHLWLKDDSDFHIIADNGRGINVALSDDGERTQMELAVSELYAGGKYDREVVSSGMHGIGSSAVNAVSDVFKIACKITASNWKLSTNLVKETIGKLNLEELPQNHLGYYYFIEYNKGIKVREAILNESSLKEEFDEALPPRMSTIVGFTSDLTIVKSNRVRFRKEWVEYTGFILKKFYDKDNILIELNGQAQDLTMEPYKYEVSKMIKLSHPEWSEINTEFRLYLTFQFEDDLQISSSLGCVNMVSVHKGVHIDYALNVITRNLKQKYGITHNLLTAGLKLNVILLARKVGFDSQTKVRLVYVDGLCDEDYYALDQEILQIYEENNSEVQAHVDALNELAASYEQISARNFIENMVNISTAVGENKAKSYQPVKLIDAAAPSWDRDKCELFIGEGDSAIGTILKVRDPYYHAAMPLRGVSMNVTWKTLDEAFQNDEIHDIICAINTGTDEYYDMDALRYDKIILATDADSDGCFTGDTLISLANGKEVPIKELAEEYPDGGFYVYSKDSNNELQPGLVKAVRQTGVVTKLCKVTLDNGEVINCTPNHPFRLKNGSYLKAEELRPGMSLSALYRKYSKTPSDFREGDQKYEFYYDEVRGKYLPTHQNFCITGNYVKGEVNQVHHIDHDTRNNDPSNLILITASEHRRLHMIEYNKSEKHKLDNSSSTLLKETAREIMTDYNKSDEHKEVVAELNRDTYQIQLQYEGKILRTIGKLVYLNLPINSFYYEAFRPRTAPKGLSTKYLKDLWNSYLLDDEDYYTNKYVNSCEGINYESEIEKQVNLISSYQEDFLIQNFRLILRDLPLTYENYSDLNEGPGKFSMTNGREKLYALSLLSKDLREWLFMNLPEDEISAYNKMQIEFMDRYQKLPEKSFECYYELYGSTGMFFLCDDLNEWISSYNHKVLSVEFIQVEPTPVYNMSVDEYENYALSAGVFVHNCHIAALLLGVFASFMKFLIEGGHVYILESPLYKQDGHFIYHDNISELDKSRPFERYKGLGSMHAYTKEGYQEIKDVFINPETRRLTRVTKEGMDLAIMTLGDKFTRNILMKSRNLVHNREESNGEY